MQRFEIGRVYTEKTRYGEVHLRYKVLGIDPKSTAMAVEVLYNINGLWSFGERDVFSLDMCEGDELDKEYNIKTILSKLDESVEKESRNKKGSQQRNEGNGKQKPKKGCKTCDSKGCRCNARSKRSV